MYGTGGQLIVDKIYHGLTYEREASTALKFGDDIFVVQSFSKYFNMTGWRHSWLVVPERFAHDIEKLAQNLFIATSTPAQYAALAAFHPDTIAIPEKRRVAFGRHRDYPVPEIEKPGFRLRANPKDVFYLYADCSKFTSDSERFAGNLIATVGVATTPGLDFGSHAAKSHLRFAYTTRSERLIEAVDRIRHFGVNSGYILARNPMKKMRRNNRYASSKAKRRDKQAAPTQPCRSYFGRDPVGKGQAPVGLSADFNPGVAAVDGADAA